MPDQQNENGEKSETEKEEKSEGEPEKPLTDNFKALLGEDPTKSKARKMQIHSQLRSRWQHYALNGLSKEERDEALQKYEIPEDLEAPLLNEQIQTRISDRLVRKDGYRLEIQKSTSAAMTALGAALTMMDTPEEDGFEDDDILECLIDAGKLLADMQFKQSESRKMGIMPRLSKPFQEILKKSKSDKFLFGKDLSAKIKDLKDSDKLFKDISKEKPKQPSTSGTSGNFRRPLDARFRSNRQGSTGFSERGRRRLFFRGSSYRDQRRGQGPKQGLKGKAPHH